jgi:hypothetical protein
VEVGRQVAVGRQQLAPSADSAVVVAVRAACGQKSMGSVTVALG